MNRDGQRGREEGRPVDAAHLVVEHGLIARGELAQRKQNPRGDARADEHRGRGVPIALQHERAGGSRLGIEAHLAQFIDEERFESGDGRDQKPPGGAGRLGRVHGPKYKSLRLKKVRGMNAPPPRRRENWVYE